MATMNHFDLLGDDDAEDPSQLIAAQQQKVTATPLKKGLSQPQVKLAAQPQAKLPSKPLPPAQAVREAKSLGGRGGGGDGRGRGRGYARGRGGYNRDSASSEKSFGSYGAPAFLGGAPEDDAGKAFERHGYGAPRSSFRGARRGSFANGDVGEGGRPRRAFERHSGTGRGNEIKREGAGRGNWGTQADELIQVVEEAVDENEKNLATEKPVGEEEAVADAIREKPDGGPEEEEPEDKEMTLEEYEKVLEEKRRALQALRTEERKVDTKVFQSMQQLSSKKGNNDVFIKSGSDKDKRKEASEKDEKNKKSSSINELLKPAEREKYYSPGGRSQGRGQRSKGFSNRDGMSNAVPPSMEDPGQFPCLGAK